MPGPDASRVAVIVPVFNGAATIEACLRALQLERGVDEIIVVDDGSTDATPASLSRFEGLRVIRHSEARGAPAARNAGANATQAGILAFVDADVVVRSGTIATLVQELRRDSAAVATVGIYASSCGIPGFVSEYKNLWIRQSYLRGPRQIDWMTTACCVVRHPALAAIGYFDPSKSAATATDDIDVGRRLTAAGGKIRLVPAAEVEHRKHYSLAAFCRNEWIRSRAWTQLAWQQLGVGGVARRQSFNNIPLSFVSGMVTQGVALLGMLAGLAGARSGWWVFAVGMAVTLALHYRWLGYLVAERGVRFTVASVPVLCLDLLCCGLGLLVGTLEFTSGRTTTRQGQTPANSSIEVVTVNGAMSGAGTDRLSKDSGQRGAAPQE